MKLKDVCTETGLSRKTIRLYEERGLIVPHKERRNGRDYREYSQEDIARLNTIALLRKAWFTLDEIARMLEDPEALQEILPQYKEWLRKQKAQVDALLQAAETLNIPEIQTVAELTEKIGPAASTLPLPRYDVKPRFRYLDEMEETPMKKDKEIYHGATSDSKEYRQVLLISDQDKVNNQAITFGQIRELENKEFKEDGPVKREVAESKTVKLLCRIGTVLMILGFAGFALVELIALGLGGRQFTIHSLSLSAILTAAAFFVGLIIYGSAHGYAVYQERKRWLELVRRQDAEKRNGTPAELQPEEPSFFKTYKVPILIGSIALVIILCSLLALPIMKNAVEPDCTLVIVTNRSFTEEEVQIFKNLMEQSVGDINKDGASRHNVTIYKQSEYLNIEDNKLPTGRVFYLTEDGIFNQVTYRDELKVIEGTGDEFMDYAIPVGEEWLGGIPASATEIETRCYENFFTLLMLSSITDRIYEW